MTLGSWRNVAILPVTARLPVTHPFLKVREKGTRSPAGLLLKKLFAFCSPYDILRVRRAAELRSAGRPRRPSPHGHSRCRENLFSDAFSCWLLIRPQAEINYDATHSLKHCGYSRNQHRSFAG